MVNIGVNIGLNLGVNIRVNLTVPGRIEGPVLSARGCALDCGEPWQWRATGQGRVGLRDASRRLVSGERDAGSRTRCRGKRERLVNAEPTSDMREVGDVLGVVLQEFLECALAAVLFVVKPQVNSIGAVESYGLAADAELQLDLLLPAAEPPVPAVVHQVAVLQVFGQVQPEMMLDERQVEPLAVEGVERVRVSHGIEDAPAGQFCIVELNHPAAAALFHADAHDREFVLVPIQPGGLDVNICACDAAVVHASILASRRSLSIEPAGRGSLRLTAGGAGVESSYAASNRVCHAGGFGAGLYRGE